MSLAMRPNEVNTEVQYDCKVRHQAVIFLYTEVLDMRKNLTITYNKLRKLKKA